MNGVVNLSVLDGWWYEGKQYKITVTLNEQGLDDAIGLEFVSLRTEANGEERIQTVVPMNVVSRDGNRSALPLLQSEATKRTTPSKAPWTP